MQIAPQRFRQSCRLQVAIKPSWAAGAAAQYKPRGHLGATGSAALANAGRTAGDLSHGIQLQAKLRYVPSAADISAE